MNMALKKQKKECWKNVQQKNIFYTPSLLKKDAAVAVNSAKSPFRSISIIVLLGRFVF